MSKLVIALIFSKLNNLPVNFLFIPYREIITANPSIDCAKALLNFKQQNAGPLVINDFKELLGSPFKLSIGMASQREPCGFFKGGFQPQSELVIVGQIVPDIELVVSRCCFDCYYPGFFQSFLFLYQRIVLL